jgi:hypothetical protein
MRDQRVVRPVGRLEIAHDQQLRRRIETKFDAIGVDRPTALRRDGRGDLIEVTAGQPFVALWKVRQADAEIAAQAFLQRLIWSDVVIAIGQVEG